jgi:RNA polymerase sigma-70 factor (ECF subfamily)
MFGGGQRSGEKLRAAIAARYEESGGRRFGLTPEKFEQIVGAVVERYAAAEKETEQVALVRGLHVADLVLARACAEGNEAAWEHFLTRYRAALYEAAYRIAKNDGTGRELADELYADLYGLPNKAGNRVCRLDYYMGRGSMEGWLRTVLAQQYVNRHRSRAREVSLDEQLEAGTGFPAPQPEQPAQVDPLAAAVSVVLKAVEPEERFLLAAWYLDGKTLAEIGKQLGVHESTVSRRLDRVTSALRKRVRKRLQAAGWSARECDERMQALDVRDLDVNVGATLRQESAMESFNK